MNWQNVKFLTLPAMVFAFFLTSCSDEEIAANNQVIDERETTAADLEAEEEFTSVFEFADDEMAMLEQGLDGGRVSEHDSTPPASENLPDCAVKTFDAENLTLTIDFGPEDCLCRDGLYRRGKITVTQSEIPRKQGTTRTITLENYYVNGNRIKGSKTLEQLSGEGQNLKYTVTVSDAEITTDFGTSTWESSWTIERTAGNDTYHPFDDIYLVTGNSSGVNRRGISYSAEIIEPLKKVREYGCRRTFVAGIIAYTADNAAWTMNYDPTGEEPCDRLGEITKGDETYTITLR